MGDTLDADAGDGCAGQRREQDTPQRVAEGVAKASIQRLDRERAAVLFDGLCEILGTRKSSIARVPSFGGVGASPLCPTAAKKETARGCQRKPRPPPGNTGYFEYSSTMSCSSTGAAISRRSGFRSTFAVNPS
jgi:hypothetical protein